MIFLTVGTQFPFDRLVCAVDRVCKKGLVYDEIFGQIGKSSYIPKYFNATMFLEKKKYIDYFNDSSAIISHAGMGTIALALEQNKPLLVMPRSVQFGEVVNNHQIAIAKKFEKRGHILVAYEPEQIPRKIHELKTFVPTARKNSVISVIQRITDFIQNEMSRK